MAFIFGSIKCCFCNKTGGVLSSVHEYGIYGDAGKRVFYHDECLQTIEIEPRKFGNVMVDKAIHINNLRKRNIRHNKDIMNDFYRNIEKLQTKNFERLMPKNEN